MADLKDVDELCALVLGKHFSEGCDLLAERLAVPDGDDADFGECLIHHYDTACIRLGQDYEDQLMRVPEAVRAMVEGALEFMSPELVADRRDAP